MPTLLSFRRAVKKHARSLGVCAALSSLGCASHGADHLAPGPVTDPVRETPTFAPADASVDVSTPSASASIANSIEANAPVVSAGIDLSFERPYPLDGRPRAASTVAAAAEDEELARWNVGGTNDPNYVSSQASFHPGTRVVVDADYPGPHRKTRRGARGLTAERIQAQTRAKGYWPFRLCFEAGQREKKGAGGETKVRFSIGLRGGVLSARVLSSELKNDHIRACLLSELKKLRFSPPPVRHTEVLASIRIWPGDVELPPLGEAPAVAPVDTTNGFMPDAVAARVLDQRIALNACFTEARKSDPTLWGRLALAVILEVDGTVHRVLEVESHFPNTAAARCAAAAVSSIVFPSVNGKPFTFVLALRLAPNVTAAPPKTTPPNENDAGDADATD